MEQISRIGMDTSKHIFQLHGVNAAEVPVVRKKLRRTQMVAFFEKLAPTVIAITTRHGNNRNSFPKRFARVSGHCAVSGRPAARFWMVILQQGRADMPKFATVGTIEVAPGRRDQLLPLLMAHKARCVENEPGSLQFEILLPHDDHAKVLLYEVYRDDAAFEVHRNGPSFARWREETAGMAVKIYGTRCAVLD